MTNNIKEGATVLNHANRVQDAYQHITSYNNGLISIAELVLALQCSEHQLKALKMYVDMPHEFQKRISIKAIDNYADQLLNGHPLIY